MFDRYRKTFAPDRNGGNGSRVVPERDTATGRLPFDLDLRRRIVGTESLQTDSAMAPAAPAPTSLEPAAPESAGALQVLGPWHGIRPAWRRQQATAQAIRGRDPAVKQATDTLRTRLLQKMKAEGWTRIALTAPHAGCGTTFTALNLALSISAVPDLKIVLLDLDQRHPDLADMLDAGGGRSLAEFLGGHLPATQYLLRYAENLAIGLNTETPPHAAELLQSRAAAETLDEMERALLPDVVLCDLPPLLDHDDALAALPLVDAVLLVADATRTLAPQIIECEELLYGKAPLLGVILNRGRGPA